MPDCNKRLTLTTGAWIGTVAHIVSAEDGGPRADPAMTPTQRRDPSNLLLLCADHGREIDDPMTGERLFPCSKLESIKKAHESRFATLIDQMLQSAPAARTVDDFLDTSHRAGIPSRNCSRFIEQSGLSEAPELAAQARAEIEVSQRLLRKLSNAALTTFSTLVGMCELDLTALPGGPLNYSEGLGWQRSNLSVHESILWNRELDNQKLRSALDELTAGRLVYPPSPDDDSADRVFELNSPWSDVRTGDSPLCRSSATF